MGGAAGSGGKRSAGERMKAESTVSHGRSWPPSLAYSLTGARPPSTLPPALTASTAADHRLWSRPQLALGSCPTPLRAGQRAGSMSASL